MDFFARGGNNRVFSNLHNRVIRQAHIAPVKGGEVPAIENASLIKRELWPYRSTYSMKSSYYPTSELVFWNQQVPIGL